MDFNLCGGTQTMGFISPFDTNDTYAVIDPLYGIDGFRNVANLTELNAIPNLRRRAGMVVGVSGGTEYYKLNSPPWSGITADWSEFTLGGGVDTFVSGSTIQTGYTGDTLVLTRNDGVEMKVSLAASTTYENSNPTLVDIGGIEAGSTFQSTPLQDMWTDLLYPELTPKFTSFDLAGIGTIVEVGYTILSGTHTFNWVTANPSFITPESLRIRDISSPYTFMTGGTNDGTEVVTFPSSIQKTASSSHTWRIDATRLNTSSFYRNHTISWYWRKYWGESVNPTLTTNQITGLTNNNLSNTENGSYDFVGGGYKYIVYPTSFGSPNFFKDESTNLQVAMADNSDGYSTLSNGYYYNTIAITNQYGIVTTYRVYRTKNILGGAISIIIT